jgi:hypothetical protein
MVILVIWPYKGYGHNMFILKIWPFLLYGHFDLTYWSYGLMVIWPFWSYGHNGHLAILVIWPVFYGHFDRMEFSMKKVRWCAKTKSTERDFQFVAYKSQDLALSWTLSSKNTVLHGN